jgi:hypothetical protein
MTQTEEAKPSSSNNMFTQGIQSITNTINDAKNQVSQSINEFSAQPNAPSEFSFSNTIVAKFAFLLLVIILFMFFINLGINLITYSISAGNNPYLIKGLRSGKDFVSIPQDPRATGSISILRSNNQSRGAEFTWSIWLFIDDLKTSNVYQHIFNKGDKNFGNDGIALVNNAPGLYLGNGGDSNNPINTLRIIMDTVSSSDSSTMPPTTRSSTSTMSPTTLSRSTTLLPSSNSEDDTQAILDITGVPLKKWFHVAVRLENSVLDVYVNGTIDKRQRLNNAPKQNYFDINVCYNEGFDGKLSDLRYFSSALNVFQLNTIVSKGPNLSTNRQYEDDVKLIDYNYLSTLWYGI